LVAVGQGMQESEEEKELSVKMHFHGRPEEV